MRELVIFGTGGIGRQVRQIVADINAANPRWRLVGFLDDNADLHGQTIHGLEVLGDSSWLGEHYSCDVVVAVGAPHVRKNVVEKLREFKHLFFPPIIHPLTWIGENTVVAEGSIVYPGVLIDTDVVIGRHNVLNKSCTVGHDTVLGDYVTVGPGVNLGGMVSIGHGCDLGISCSTIQNVKLGAWSVVGAGAVVIRDVPEGTTVVGVPAKPIK